MLVAPGQKVRSRVAWRGMNSLVGAALFVAPLLVLVAIWAIVVPLFNVNPRIFPSVGSVAEAAVAAIGDGSLIRHVGASMLRVGLGTFLGVLVAVPLGVAMGVSPAVSAFLTPLFRFFSVLAGIAWIPIATLWFGYGFGAIIFVIFNAVFFVVAYNTLLGVSTIPMTIRNAAASLGAGRWALLTEVRRNRCSGCKGSMRRPPKQGDQLIFGQTSPKIDRIMNQLKWLRRLEYS